MFLAETPTVTDSGIFLVRVCDSANQAHSSDTRGPDDTGVGSGIISFTVESTGKPTLCLFAPGEQFTSLPIAIGRAEPLSSWGAGRVGRLLARAGLVTLPNTLVRKNVIQ